jgi:DNA-binding response OmpR family regulator
VLIVEDEPYMAEAIRDGLRLEAIAADIAGDGDSALDLTRLAIVCDHAIPPGMVRCTGVDRTFVDVIRATRRRARPDRRSSRTP